MNKTSKHWRKDLYATANQPQSLLNSNPILLGYNARLLGRFKAPIILLAGCFGIQLVHVHGGNILQLVLLLGLDRLSQVI